MAAVRARTVFSDQELSVTAIESVEFQSDRSNGRGFVYGSLTPIAVVVKQQERTYALDMDAQPIDIGQLELPVDFDLD